MNQEDEDSLNYTRHAQEMLFKAGLIGNSELRQSTMKLTYQWTADGLAFRAAVFKAYDAIAKTQGDKSLEDFCGLIAFILETRYR